MSRRHSGRDRRRQLMPVDPFDHHSRFKMDRKALQLCEQVRETLHWILSDVTGEDLLASCTVQAVEPLSGANRLLVRVGVPEGVPVSEVERLLKQHSKTLRMEVAESITRRKAPELVYLAVPTI